MKKALTQAVAAAALAALSGPALAQAVPSKLGEAFSVDVGGTYLSGEGRETVYDPETRRRMSYLNWRFDRVYAVTAGLTYHVLPTVALRVNGWAPIEKSTGSMKDFDWLMDSPNWTHLSRSPTSLREAYKVDASLAVSFWTTDPLSLYAIGGYRQQSLHFVSRGGSYVYSQNGFRDATGDFDPSEKGITYLQTSKTPYLGLGATADMGPARLTAEVVGSLFTKTDAKDTHHMRDLVFYDRTYNGKFLGATVKGEYDLVPGVALTGAVSYDNLFDAKGKTRILDLATGDSAVAPRGSSGSGSTILGVTVGIKARL